MAGFGWSNMMHGSENKRPLASTQIACRICDQVFSSNRSLINHIETHIVENESDVASRRPPEINDFMLAQRDFLAKRRNAFLHGGAAACRLVPQAPLPLSQPSLSMTVGVFGSKLPPRYNYSRRVQVAAAEPGRDLIKPSLNQSHQITIPATNRRVEREDGNVHDSETLDLTLKL